MKHLRLDPNKVKVGTEKRRALGDIKTLERSLELLGQIQPIVITQRFELVSGFRRVSAAINLGWEDIDAVIIKQGLAVVGLSARKPGSRATAA